MHEKSICNINVMAGELKNILGCFQLGAVKGTVSREKFSN